MSLSWYQWERSYSHAKFILVKEELSNSLSEVEWTDGLGDQEKSARVSPTTSYSLKSVTILTEEVCATVNIPSLRRIADGDGQQPEPKIQEKAFLL